MSEVIAIEGTRRQVKELVDGTLSITVHVEPRDKADFHRLFPNIDMPIAIAPLAASVIPARSNTGASGGPAQIGEARRDKTLAERLHASGYFFNRKLWQALHDSNLYTVQAHKQWVQARPCLLGMTNIGNAPKFCNGDVCAHHAGTADTPAAGTGLQPENPQKPPHWFTVPLCHTHHDWIHGAYATREHKTQLNKAAIELMSISAKRVLKEYAGLESLADLQDDMLDNFGLAVGLK